MTRHCYAHLLAAILLLAPIGCDHKEYTVELTPQGHSIDRTLTAMIISDDGSKPFPAEETAAFADLYSEALETENDQTVSFQGRFTREMPDDIGGEGNYIVYETVLGDGVVYSEQFRGSDEPARFFGEYFAWADQVVDILIGWLETELGDTAGWDEFETFLDTDIRSDLKDLGVYYYLGANRPQMLWEAEVEADPFVEQVFARVLQYLLTHDYFTVEQFPLLTRAFDAGDELDEQLATLVTDILRRKAGIDDEALLTALHDLLRDTEKMEVSLGEYITVNVPLTEDADEPSDSDDSDEDAPPSLPAPPIEFGFGPQDKLSLTLNLPNGAAVVNTNGLGVEGTPAAVTWSTDLPEKDLADYLPVLCFATWALPNEAGQTQHLGKVALTGEELFSYALWRNSLTPQEAIEWDAAIEALSPDDEASVDALGTFRFSHEQMTDPDGAPTQPQADQGIHLLLSAMENDTDDGDDPEE